MSGNQRGRGILVLAHIVTVMAIVAIVFMVTRQRSVITEARATAVGSVDRDAKVVIAVVRGDGETTVADIVRVHRGLSDELATQFREVMSRSGLSQKEVNDFVEGKMKVATVKQQ